MPKSYKETVVKILTILKPTPFKVLLTLFFSGFIWGFLYGIIIASTDPFSWIFSTLTGIFPLILCWYCPIIPRVLIIVFSYVLSCLLCRNFVIRGKAIGEFLKLDKLKILVFFIFLLIFMRDWLIISWLLLLIYIVSCIIVLVYRRLKIFNPKLSVVYAVSVTILLILILFLSSYPGYIIPYE